MKVLVIGKNGALGSVLAEAHQGPDLTAWGREDLDVTKEQDVLKKITDVKPDLVYNCVADNNVDRAEQDPETANAVNGQAPGYMAKACREIGATFVHFSSDYVFDGKNQKGYNETDQPNPINAYGRSKLLGEQQVQKNTDKFYIIRTAWLFGGAPRVGTEKKSFVTTMLELAEKNEPIKIVNDQFGTPTYIPELANSTQILVKYLSVPGIYHVINKGQASRFDWAKEIFEVASKKVDLVPISYKDVKSAAPRPQYSILLNNKMPRLRSWQSALKDYLHNES